MAMFGLPQGGELIIILLVVLVLFGPSQLPKLAKMFGKSAKALKDGMEGTLADEDDKTAEKPKDASTTPTPPTDVIKPE